MSTDTPPAGAAVTEEDRRQAYPVVEAVTSYFNDHMDDGEAAEFSANLTEDIAQALANTRREAEADHINSNATLSQELFKVRAEKNRAEARIAELEAERDRLADALKCAELGHQEGRV